MNRQLTLLVILVIVISLQACANKADRGPHDELLPPIVQEYWACSKCGSLDGGIYGKGPLVHFRTQHGATCVHKWVRITREDFLHRASSEFGKDWTKEMPFWQRSNEK